MIKKFGQSGAAPVLVLVAVIGLVGFLAVASTASFKGSIFSNLFPKEASHAAGNSFLETFNGAPTAPEPYLLEPGAANWDIAVHSRDITNFLQLTPMDAQHGLDCGAPIDANGNLVSHPMAGSYLDAVFNCKDHIMTSIRAGVHGAPDEFTVQPANTDGYGIIYLVPNQLVDFSSGMATVKFDMSTLVTSKRDWIDMWLTPYSENLQLPLDHDLPDLQGTPKNAVHIRMDGARFNILVIRNYQETNITMDGFSLYDSILTESPKDRTTFQLDISPTHIKFGIPAQTLTANRSLYWVDADIPALGWNQAVLQLGHHSYNPNKDCGIGNTGYQNQCRPNTWHWDNVSIAPSVPFTIIKADKRYVSPNPASGQPTSDTVTFSQPAPANAFLRFSSVGTTQVSFNGGTSWVSPVRQLGNNEAAGVHHPEHFSSYFTPIPQGTQSVKFKLSGDDWYNGSWPYEAKDFAIWSTTVTAQPTVTPSSSPALTPTPAATPNPLPGDINGSKKVDILDYNLMITDFGATSGLGLRSDINSSGKVDILDYNLLITNYGKSIP